MCDANMADSPFDSGRGSRVPLERAVGMALAHDITEIRQGAFKGAAFRKGHRITDEDISRLRRLGKDHVAIVEIRPEDLHEDDAACLMADALCGSGVGWAGEPREGKLNLVALRDGLLRVDTEALFEFNMLGDVMCATLHDRSVIRKGRCVGATRAIPLVIERRRVESAVTIAKKVGGVLSVQSLRQARVGVVITGNEVFHGRIEDAFGPVIRRKVSHYGGAILDIRYAPDDEAVIERHLRELLAAGADLLVTTGGMSVDPDDVTRHAIRRLGVSAMSYGSPVLPGAMFLVAYLDRSDNGNDNPVPSPNVIPILGVPACGMYARTTVFDLILPRVLAGERVGRLELARLGHGGLCLSCDECRYPVCPLGKG